MTRPTGTAAITRAEVAGSALDELRALHRAGRLADEYPRVGQLLATLTPADAARVGGWLARVDPAAVHESHPSLAAVRLAVTGNATTAPVVPHLAARAGIDQVVYDVYLSDFNQYRQELLAPDSDLYAFQPQVTLCLLDHHAVIDGLPSPWEVDDAVAVLQRTSETVAALVAAFGEHGSGVLVLNTLPLTRLLTRQLVDYRSRSRLAAAWRRFNAGVHDLGATHEHVVTVDLEVLGSDVPIAADPRISGYGKQHLTEELLAEYAREVSALARALLGRPKKCLVLDLDNTLWGGVLAEDGAAGITVGGDLEGAAFAGFQRLVRQLGAQGVLLAVSSKNDLDEVRAVLREHPDMVIREEDLVLVNANWRPKDENLTEIAQSLNLHPDAFVFMDDSAFECDLVQRRHPGTGVVRADGDPALHAEQLLAGDWFAVRTLTSTDRERSRSYRAGVERQSFLARSPSLDDFLRNLDLHVELRPPREHELTRLSQLTLRTNQFNQTTVRLDLPELRRLVADPSALVLAIASRDRCGDDGIVGAVLARRAGEAQVLDNFLLSCRVFSRGIESACLSALLHQARDVGLGSVVGLYRPSRKNGKVADFYPRHGFRADSESPLRAELSESPDPYGTVRFRHDLYDIAPPPDHVRLHIEWSS